MFKITLPCAPGTRSYAPCTSHHALCPWRSALSFRLPNSVPLCPSHHAIFDLISQLADLFLSIRNPKSKIRNRFTRNPQPATRTPQPVPRTPQPVPRIHFLSDKRAYIIELVLHGFHDHFKGIGFDFQALPGEMVQGWNFIVSPVAHIKGPT